MASSIAQTPTTKENNACAPCHYTPSASIYVDPLRPSPLNTFRYVSRASRLHCPLAEVAQLHLMRALDTAEARYVYAPSDNSLAAQYMESSNYSACTHGYVEQKHIDYHHRNQKDVYIDWARVVTTLNASQTATDSRQDPFDGLIWSTVQHTGRASTVMSFRCCCASVRTLTSSLSCSIAYAVTLLPLSALCHILTRIGGALAACGDQFFLWLMRSCKLSEPRHPT